MIVLLTTTATAFTAPSWTHRTVGPQVSGHAASVDEDGRTLAYGGLMDGAGSPCTDELHAFGDGAWSKLETIGEAKPGKRMYASSAVLDGAYYLFGGWDPEAPGTGGAFLDDAWRLDLGSLKWTALDALPCGPVSRHTSCTVGNLILVHTFRSTLVCDGDAVRMQPTTGEGPAGFSMCAAAPLGQHEMLVFGGSTKTQGMTGDAFVLDTRTWEWRKLRTVTGEAVPTPRGSSCAAPIDGRTCVIYGGAGLGGDGYAGGAGLTPFDETWTLHVDGDEASWTRLELGLAPPARVAASLSPLPSGEFLLHGGWTPLTKETFDASYVLKL